MKYIMIIMAFCPVVTGFSFAGETTIGAVLANPKAHDGRLLELSGTVSDVKPMTAAGYYFFRLSDESGGAIVVRSSRPGHFYGDSVTLKGRLRSEPLQGRYIIIEEEFILGTMAPALLEPPLPPADAVAPDPAAPAATEEPDMPDEPAPADYAEPAPPDAAAPVSTLDYKPPASLAPPQAVLGEYAVVFNKASSVARNLLISEIGRLATSVLHPTCTFSSNQLESNFGLGTAGRAVFRTAYKGLLIGDHVMRWEVLFDNNGMLSDVRLLSDSSPLTNVDLINTVKDRIIQYLKQQLANLGR